MTKKTRAARRECLSPGTGASRISELLNASLQDDAAAWTMDSSPQLRPERSGASSPNPCNHLSHLCPGTAVCPVSLGLTGHLLSRTHHFLNHCSSAVVAVGRGCPLNPLLLSSVHRLVPSIFQPFAANSCTSGPHPLVQGRPRQAWTNPAPVVSPSPACTPFPP